MACISKRRDRYVIDFYDNQGKRRWKTLPKGTAMKDAKAALRDIEEKIDKGVWLPPKRIPDFSDFADTWLKLKKPNIRHSTYKQYKGHCENHLKPFFKGYKINRIGYAEAEKFVAHCLESGVATLTLKKILVNLGSIMTNAVRMRYIDYNPARDIEKPRGQSAHKEGDKLNVLNPAQIQALQEATPDLKHKILFMAAVTTGLRQGELLGLKWTDLDWINNQVHVNRTYNHFSFYEPKTKTSKRKVDVPQQMMKQFKVWKLACPANDLDLVFPNEDGKPMSSLNMYNRVWLPTVKKMGLSVRFHDLRHTYASLQIDLGANPKYIQSQMGHSSIRITLDTYGHLMKDINKEAANRLGQAIFFDAGSKMVAENKKGATSTDVTP